MKPLRSDELAMAIIAGVKDIPPDLVLEALATAMTWTFVVTCPDTSDPVRGFNAIAKDMRRNIKDIWQAKAAAERRHETG